ncbi:PP2C family protein-serine/threonine phosphatase [Actinokineospora spheciospongiae]|uniref:PP2C family protein-serine/threonine phosphatase n=1 Tax=Actinokineospora spheciospongiae TaxID=909613 RepID=UPI000D9BC6DD|nr:serine/threonine protein phosphatase [Actinokineospora spheciospongiae]PWW62352.1 protein phosphatase [Actinokineospora spheciospongiae]
MLSSTIARTAGSRGERTVNADAVASFPDPRTGRVRYALADGVGDDPGAARAARVAAAAAVRSGLGAAEAVLAAQAEVREAGSGDCVLVVAVPDADGYDIAWVGDARAYAWTAGGLRALTTDHTLAQYFRDHGTPVTPRMEHLVTTSVRTVEPHRVGTARVSEPASLLLTSDGVHKALGDAVMARVLRYSADAAAALVEAATAAGTSDNATALVVHCAGRPTTTLPDRAPDLSTAALPVATVPVATVPMAA